MLSHSAVRMTPAQTALTRMGAISSARPRVSDSSACTGSDGRPTFPRPGSDDAVGECDRTAWMNERERDFGCSVCAPEADLEDLARIFGGGNLHGQSVAGGIDEVVEAADALEGARHAGFDALRQIGECLVDVGLAA